MVGKTRFFKISSGARITVDIPATGSFSLNNLYDVSSSVAAAEGNITGGAPGVPNTIFGPASGAYFTKDTMTLPSNHIA